jgi:hypothetical protein
MDYSLSGNDIKDYLGRVKIVPYSYIKTYADIDDLLEPFDKVVILYKTADDYGHWCCIFRVGNMIEFFCSYGIMIDDQLAYNKNKKFKIQNEQDHFYLTRLLAEAPEKVSYNHYKFQKFGDHITTCGRWCILRLLNTDLTLKQFHKEVVEEAREKGFGRNYDKLVVDLIKI